MARNTMSSPWLNGPGVPGLNQVSVKQRMLQFLLETDVGTEVTATIQSLHVHLSVEVDA